MKNNYAGVTLQRLKDLKEVASSNKVRVLANIMIDYVKNDPKEPMGFIASESKEGKKDAV